MDTIFAEASAAGKAGVSVIRVSGPSAFACAATLVRGTLPDRGAVLRNLHDGDGGVLDSALVLTFTAPGSFTGEDVVELQVHGSRAIVAAVLARLGTYPDARLAEPGEFTRRALENGKLDLTQVEGLADLIDAETEAQRQQAQRVFAGGIGALAEIWRKDLIRAAALLEATIDFADEDVPEDVTPEVTQLLTDVCVGLERESKGVGIAERVRTGFEVAIVGEPNVGKSTLLNLLAGRSAAITSDVAGTTRDVIEVRMDLRGLPVTLLDTAGLRKTTDVVEEIGVDRALSRAAQADLRVLLSADGVPGGLALQPDDIVLRPKLDKDDGGAAGISGVTGHGVDALVDHIGEVLSKRVRSAGTATRQRHLTAMTSALDALTAAREILVHGPEQYDIAAEEIRTAIRGLESLVGRIDVDSLLDEIFLSFCLGK